MKFVSTLLAVIFVGTLAFAEETGNPAAGKSLAEANCSQCHNTAPGGAFKLFPPSFAAIATYMDPDIIRIRIMYPDHVVIMPQFHTYMNLTNMDDLMAYIVSLEKK